MLRGCSPIRGHPRFLSDQGAHFPKLSTACSAAVRFHPHAFNSTPLLSPPLRHHLSPLLAILAASFTKNKRYGYPLADHPPDSCPGHRSASCPVCTKPTTGPPGRKRPAGTPAKAAKGDGSPPSKDPPAIRNPGQ